AQEPLVEMTATLNVVVSINSTTVMQTYWTAPLFIMEYFHAWNLKITSCNFQILANFVRRGISATSCCRMILQWNISMFL
ncbi:MAG: hypothetical protein MR877_03895, partial [Spirochaetia bacterium]|nr:hypothetical protein [Spirochaetia bacterium]